MSGGVLSSSVGGLVASRASAGFDLDVLTVFAPNQPRRNGAGLLVEPSGSNRLLRSTDLTQAWSKSNTLIGETQDDGTQLVTEGVGSSEVLQTVTGVTAGAAFLFSVVLKRGNHNWCRIRIDEGGGGEFGNCWVNLATGTVGTVSTSGGGWMVFPGMILLSGGRFLFFGGYLPNGSTATRRVRISSAAGDGNLMSVDNATRFQGFHQLEPPSSLPRSHTVTAGSAVTRAADVITDSVPAVASQCTLTYSNGSTALLTDLTPGGSLQLPPNPLRTTLLSMDFRA